MTAAPIRGRFAPSPTGPLHVGNLRTALLAWLFARTVGGRFVVRMEDLDGPRVRLDSAGQQLADLRWLGLDWDEGPDLGGPFGPYTQSLRTRMYDAALSNLREAGLLYPCYCTRADLNRLASAPQGDESPAYPGTCRDLSAREIRRRDASGRRSALRFRAPETPIEFTDLLTGPLVEDVAAVVGDFVVRRSDGVVAYQLAVVVDDALMDITQVVRGADLLGSTPRQLALYAALGYQIPRHFAHVPLAVDEDGVRMAKRHDSVGLDAMRAEGARPERVLGALAASCGLWPHGAPATLDQLLATFDPTRITPFATAITN